MRKSCPTPRAPLRCLDAYFSRACPSEGTAEPLPLANMVRSKKEAKPKPLPPGSLRCCSVSQASLLPPAVACPGFAAAAAAGAAPLALVAAVKAPAPASTPLPCPCPRLLLLSQLLRLLLPPPRLPLAQPNVATLGMERGGRQRSTMDTFPGQSAACGGKGCSAPEQRL